MFRVTNENTRTTSLTSLESSSSSKISKIKELIYPNKKSALNFCYALKKYALGKDKSDGSRLNLCA